ncbi:MAG TPA: peroxidase [Sorangium sp.]|nr:peroxidase [Sorangium sp.]
MLELDDIQHFLLERTPGLAGRYEFLSFQDSAAGRAWLAGMMNEVTSAAQVRSSPGSDHWVTLAFTWSGLNALGVDDAALATFPVEFRAGMAARAAILGATGHNAPDRWIGRDADPALHALVILFARDGQVRDRWSKEHAQRRSAIPGVDVLSSLEIDAIAPEPREHFGYRDRLSDVPIEGAGGDPQPGSGPPVMPGEFFLGYVDESGAVPPLPEPAIVTKNGSYLAYFRLEEHVALFRDFLRRNAGTREDEELLAAKLMGRWRSGAPLVLAPERDDPTLATDPRRTNDFDYGKMDPYGYKCPIGAHIRRVNPRDTVANIQRRRLIRRGGTYGPPLPEGAADDGVERGVAGFIGCASLVRQFEFAMNVWVNDPTFKGLGNERDPIIGTQDGTSDMTIPRRPIRRKLEHLPAFTTLRGGAYFFVPGLHALEFLANREGRSG